jgi:hypothetical protein
MGCLLGLRELSWLRVSVGVFVTRFPKSQFVLFGRRCGPHEIKLPVRFILSQYRICVNNLEEGNAWFQGEGRATDILDGKWFIIINPIPLAQVAFSIPEDIGISLPDEFDIKNLGIR